jgi:outer membrane receptor for Fe3+-dicitrate
MCIDMDSVVKVEVVKGAAPRRHGPDAANGIVIIYAKPGPASNRTARRAMTRWRSVPPPDLVMSHQQAINLTEQQRQTIQSTMLDTQKKLSTRFKLKGSRLQLLLRA